MSVIIFHGISLNRLPMMFYATYPGLEKHIKILSFNYVGLKLHSEASSFHAPIPLGLKKAKMLQECQVFHLLNENIK